MAPHSHPLSAPRGNLSTFLIALFVMVAVSSVIGASASPSAEDKIQKVNELFDYAELGDFPKFQAGFWDQSTYRYSGGPGLPWTGPFKGQDSCLKALGIYNTLFEFKLGTVDTAVSPRTGKVIAHVGAKLKALESGVEFEEDCFLYITLNDDLLVTEIVESCNSLAEFNAIQTKSCAKKFQECAKQHEASSRA